MSACFSLFIAAIILALGACLSIVTKKLTPFAGLSAFGVGAGIYAGAGWAGLTVLAAFFIMATLATAHKKQIKATLEAKPQHPERRKAGQVLANGGVAAVSGLISICLPEQYSLFSLMIAAALSAATADTLSSELGMVYGRNAINVLTFKKEAKGLDGVVSIEGTLLGLAGSLVIAGTYCAFTGFNLKVLLIVVAAGTLGNLIDSVLGALLERKHLINNNIVNTLNTLTGAVSALALWQLLK